MVDQTQKAFSDLDDAAVVDLARAANARVDIASEYFQTVVANLRGLHRHATIVADALAAEPDAPEAPETFEP